MCFLTLPVFACVIHYLGLGREIAQCNWSESRYGIIWVLFFRVFTTFTITVISEVMKSIEKLSRVIVIVMWWNFTHLCLCLCLCYLKKMRKKERVESWKIVKPNIVKLCKVVIYLYCYYTISMDQMGVGRYGNAN